MRARILVPIIAGSLVAVSAGGASAMSIARSSAFATAASHLQSTWDQDKKDGVPPASLKPLEDKLQTQRPDKNWWNITWLRSDSLSLITDLQKETDVVWQSALTAARAHAKVSIDEWTTFVSQQTTWVTADAAATAHAWPAQLTAAKTPAELDALTSTWHTYTEQQRVAVKAAQKAKLDAEMAAAGGPEAVLANADQLVATANADNIDDAGVTQLAAQLRAELAAGSDGTVTGELLLTAVDALQGLVDLNNQVAGQVRPLMLSVVQAEAEGTPNAAGLAAQYQSISSTFQNARTSDEINAVAGQVTTLQGQVTAELNANQCGHNVGAGKVITASLSLQEMIFYQDGCVAQATPITTGRPQLPTPSGTFSIFYKASPFTMVSPWPPGSPFWYPTTPVAWVMEFAGGGYFIHDADWEADGSYGPGGENDPDAASHGCIHVPTPTMEWAYSWTPVGTPVLISP